MTRLTDAETDAVLAGGAWQMPTSHTVVVPAPCAYGRCESTALCEPGHCRRVCEPMSSRPIQFAGPEPDHACENCARLQAELDSMRQQRDHFERLALRGRSVAARR